MKLIIVFDDFLLTPVSFCCLLSCSSLFVMHEIVANLSCVLQFVFTSQTMITFMIVCVTHYVTLQDMLV